MDKNKILRKNGSVRHDMFWNTKQEKKFLKTLPLEKIQKYYDSMDLRSNWDNINPIQIKHYCQELLRT